MADRPPRILLVDDEQSIQTLLSYPLRKDGYEVVQATDGRDSPRTAQSNPRQRAPHALGCKGGRPGSFSAPRHAAKYSYLFGCRAGRGLPRVVRRD